MDISAEGYLRLREVLGVLGISKSTWYRGIAAGIYPRQYKIAQRAVGWSVAEIYQCLEDMKSRSRA